MLEAVNRGLEPVLLDLELLDRSDFGVEKALEVGLVLLRFRCQCWHALDFAEHIALEGLEGGELKGDFGGVLLALLKEVADAPVAAANAEPGLGLLAQNQLLEARFAGDLFMVAV
jgi:hypothetical protein